MATGTKLKDGAQGEPRDIPIDRIDELISNHRLRTGAAEEAKIDELAKSIADQGLMQPIRVYEADSGAGTSGGRFTLGFGYRRLEAHRRLKQKTIAAFVLPPAPESEIRAAQAIENLHREDLHPLEEAEACQALLADGADDVQAVAAMIGCSGRWVEGRLALLRLSPRVRQMLLDELIYLGHAQLIARLASFDDQEDVAGRICATKSHGYGIHRPRKGDMWPPHSIAETRHYVEQHQRTLDAVPWRLEAEFAGKLACSACPENSANAPGLFEDAEAPRKAVCLNAGCYKDKTKAASSAVLRASNTLVKNAAADGKKKAPTPALARKAIAEREVDFVRPGAVTAAAKRKQAPKQPTPAEKRGAKAASAKNEAQAKLDHALRKWEDDLCRRVEKLIIGDAWRVAMFSLIIDTQSWMHDVSRRGAAGAKARAALQPFLRRLGSNDDAERGELLVRFVRERGKDLIEGNKDLVADAISESIDVLDEAWLEIFPELAEAMPAKPKLEPPEEASSTKTKPRTKQRKKRAAPRSGGRTKRAAAHSGGPKAVPA